MQFESLGDSALIFRLNGDNTAPSIAATDAVLAATARLRAARIPGVLEVAPACTTVAVFYDPTQVPSSGGGEGPEEALRGRIRHALRRTPKRRRKLSPARLIEIPVCYAAEFAADLGNVAAHAGIAEDEVIERHAAAEYRVGCVGFTPGFPYLLGLPPELAVPRRSTPRTEVAAGSVAIGGAQTGIYPAASPGGWNVIGRTPLRLFHPDRAHPALLRAGDAVRFRVITRAAFDSLAQ